MVQLSDAIDNVFSEARMLLLGGQVLLGFSYRICFEKKFEFIGGNAQIAEIAGIGELIQGNLLLLTATADRHDGLYFQVGTGSSSAWPATRLTAVSIRSSAAADSATSSAFDILLDLLRTPCSR